MISFHSWCCAGLGTVNEDWVLTKHLRHLFSMCVLLWNGKGFAVVCFHLHDLLISQPPLLGIQHLLHTFERKTHGQHILQNVLSAWCDNHIYLIQKPLPLDVFTAVLTLILSFVTMNSVQSPENSDWMRISVQAGKVGNGYSHTLARKKRKRIFKVCNKQSNLEGSKQSLRFNARCLPQS